MASETKTPETLLDWYITREEKQLNENPGNRSKFLKILKEDPETISRAILENLNSDVMMACMDMGKAIQVSYTMLFCRNITKGLQQHFLK